jgi:epidermal growth factor receptor substrate 15
VSAGRPQSPIVRQQVGTPLSAQSTGDGWAISPGDKARFDQIFSGLDKANRGFITGDQAVDFFGNARLPEETLAQIWDLADINSEGRLNRDEFAVAMYLIRQQRGTKEGRGNLPDTLPPSLVPPMMRKQQAPPSQPTAPAFENAPVTKPRSAADDLFGLDALSAPPQAPQSTGGSTAGGPFQNPKSPLPPATSSSPSPPTNFKPFVPSSSFGQSIAPQQTGLSTASQTRTLQPSVSDDLLGDADPEVSQKLTSETSELANLSNQVGNLSKQMQEVQGTRAPFSATNDV